MLRRNTMMQDTTASWPVLSVLPLVIILSTHSAQRRHLMQPSFCIKKWVNQVPIWHIQSSFIEPSKSWRERRVLISSFSLVFYEQINSVRERAVLLFVTYLYTSCKSVRTVSVMLLATEHSICS
jgi:hypothetical protein